MNIERGFGRDAASARPTPPRRSGDAGDAAKISDPFQFQVPKRVARCRCPPRKTSNASGKPTMLSTVLTWTHTSGRAPIPPPSRQTASQLPLLPIWAPRLAEGGARKSTRAPHASVVRGAERDRPTRASASRAHFQRKLAKFDATRV